MTKGRVLIVDDKASMVALLARVLGERFSVATAHDGDTAITKLAAGSFDVVVSDIKMPGKDGLEVLRAAKEIDPKIEVVLMTAYASVQNAVEAIRAGAYDYLPKPFDPDEAVVKVARAVDFKKLKDKADLLTKQVEERVGFENIVGRSPAMQQVFTLLKKAAGLDLTVLVTGESGTGKELAARAIHHASARTGGPFVAVNCGALPADLIESELFGHAKGSFTGAATDKRGLVEEAEGGTLFLDEVGDLPLQLQVKLNRALQEREFRRVGETKDRKVETRFVAATNVDLKTGVAEGKFREDLFYRLHVFPVRLPPLRERKEDIPLLVGHVLERIRARVGRGPQRITQGAMKALALYMWPGNVRELENAMERAAAVAEEEAIGLDDLPEEIVLAKKGSATPASIVRLPYREAMALLHDRVTREYLQALMASTGGNVSRAAEQGGLARESLHRLLKRHAVDPDTYRAV